MSNNQLFDFEDGKGPVPAHPPQVDPATACSACGQEWYAGVEAMCIKRSACGFRAMRVQSVQCERALNPGWIKATDINRPGGWYWTRLGADDESLPQVVFIDMDNDGDAAPDFRVLCMGESSRTAKRLKQWHDRGWEFMEIPHPKQTTN